MDAEGTCAVTPPSSLAALSHEEFMHIRDLFDRVCELGPAERAEVLYRECAGRPTIRLGVEELLAAESSAGDRFLPGDGTAIDELFERAVSDAQTLPDQIGPYRIKRLLGRGGMGEVYLAEQRDPDRDVAVKILRSGLYSSGLSRRFAREVRVLGRLEHPGIARIYQAGTAQTTQGSITYYAMEFVEGPRITEFSTQHDQSDAERLELVAKIADAVQHAHTKGVIHRDLKPANILVCGQTASVSSETATSAKNSAATRSGVIDPQPKILDFGVARMVEPDTQHTALTEQGLLVGTIAYMSPEQLAGDVEALDARTDVYAIGVILYELLTGRMPYDIAGKPVPEAARIVRDEEPAPLNSDANLGAKTLDRDIQTIVSKAIARDRDRRYTTAAGLADDLRRFLRNEPIQARPATTLYQLSKFARRQRALVASILLVAATLITAVVAMTLVTIAARRDRAVAERKTIVAEGVSDVLLSALTVATPKGSVGKEPLLMDAITRIESQAEDADRPPDPEVKAVVLNIIGIIYRERGDYRKAERCFAQALEIRRRVLDPADPNLADSLNNMGLLHRRLGNTAEAVKYYQEAVALQRKSSFVDRERLARNVYNLASASIDAGNFDAAESLLEESLALHRELAGDRREILGFHLSAQSRIAVARKQWPRALSFAEQALQMQRDAVGPSHPAIVSSLRDLAAIVAPAGQAHRRLQLLREAHTMASEVYLTGSAHPVRAEVRARFVEALRESGLNEQARQVESEAAESP
jgi:eukaryotic-like serine/threonine-protein kinase